MDDLTSTTASAGAPDRARPNPRLDYALRRAASGDTEAFTRVYDATSSRVFGICLEMLRDRASAEEVTVETYVRVWATAGRFDPDREHAMSWILGIAHGLAVDRLRLVLPPVTRGRHLRVVATPVRRQGLGDRSPHVCMSLDTRRIKVALSLLPEPHRDVLDMAYFAGRTSVELADLVGSSPDVVASRIRDGLLALRRLAEGH